VPAVLIAADGRLFFEADELRLVGVGRDERMDLELAESPGEGDVPVGGQWLVPEEEHLELVEATAELVDHRMVERCAQVDAHDLGADGDSDRMDVERGEGETGQTVAFGGQMGHRADLDAPGLDGHPPGHPATGQVPIARRVYDLGLVGPTSYHGHRRPPRLPVSSRAPGRTYVTTRPRPVAPRGPQAPLRPLRWQSKTGVDRR
jgi:hypothetical protein